MSCKCKEEKTLERASQPCAESNEESFRQAFLRESKKTSQLAAERDSLLNRIQITENKAAHYIQILDQRAQDLLQLADTSIRSLHPDSPHRQMLESKLKEFAGNKLI